MRSRTDIDWRLPTSEAAAEWVVRLHASTSADEAEADWKAFKAWLDADPGHRAAFDAAEALWNEIGQQSDEISHGLAGPSSAAIFTFPLRRSAAGPLAWCAFAAAAAAALFLVGPFSPFNGVAPSLYATAKGERRTVTLADGSRIELNGGSRLTAIIGGDRREVELSEGSEAAFTVVHDASRPFVVRAGDRTIRDIGTEFNVLRNAGDLKVTVLSGMVEVGPSAGAAGQTVTLPPGRQLNHRVGSAASDVALVKADDAFSWRLGRLIYRDRPLAEVAADLSRYYAEPVRTEGAASALRFSGVLAISSEPAAINRLSALVPVSANRQDGVIVLTERAGSR